MKSVLLGCAAGGAFVAALSTSFEPARPEGVPFIDPAALAQSACGGNALAALKRKQYFLAIGAAAAKTMEAPPKREILDPVAGIGYTITTASDAAQRYFDSGVAHLWNFNHGEAVNAFKAAQAADPNCAMCFWGEAFALGPNINMPMPDDAVAPAFAAAKRAKELKTVSSTKEQALIDALLPRYSANPLKDRAPLDLAFAEAMAKVAAAYPDDDFIVSTAAEANMDTQPWDYWEADGRTPKGRSKATGALLESVLARNPTYQPAIHLYIHFTEATTNPFRAIPYADKLAALSPGLGHLVHMPSHTYARIGRYNKSIDVNLEAVKADETYLAAAQASPMYEYGYYVHNVHFVMTSAQMAGDKATALAMARKLDAKIPVEMAIEVPLAAPIKAAPYYAMVQFSAPEDILKLGDPGEDAPFLQAAWRYARGEAFARLGRIEEARAEAAAIAKLIETENFTKLTDNLIPAPGILRIQERTVTARAAAAAGDLAAAIGAMEDAVDLQESLNYSEPPYWYYPAKQTLAAMVLRAGDAERSEQLFVESLAEVPNNGWAYAGLAEAYAGQRDKHARKYAQALLKSAWMGKERPSLDQL
jgi:hypothetical protein